MASKDYDDNGHDSVKMSKHVKTTKDPNSKTRVRLMFHVLTITGIIKIHVTQKDKSLQSFSVFN